MNLRTRSELFGLLLTVPRVTTPQLIALAAPLGISASNVKSHLSRLTAEGIVRREGPPRGATYSLTERRQTVVEGIAVRLEEPPVASWNGDWFSLAVRLPKARGERETLRASLWFDGFRPWGREVWIRPVWPQPWAQTRATAYVAHGGLCVGGSIVGTANLSAMCALYAVEELDREARALAGLVDRRSRAFRTDAQAFAVRHRLAGRIVDIIARDPRLPAELWPGYGLAALRRSYRALMEATGARMKAFVARATNGM